MLMQSQCQQILHAPNLCTECTVPTFLWVYCWSTALRTPNTSHPLRHPFLGCHGFFMMFWVFSFLLFWVVCCRVLTSLVLALFLLLSSVFSYGIFCWGVSQDCDCTTWLYNCYNLPLQNWYN